MTKLDELFEFVKPLKEKYKDKEVFNLLHAIGFRSQETMHSKFIHTMLDPKSLHGMGDRNLKLFLERIGIAGFQTEQAKVEIERPAKNRWIDIKISIGDDVIIIENKVWAKDQDRQLADYYHDCKKANNRVEVIYLTLNGKCPTQNSLDEVLTLNQVKCISYEKHIIPWVDECAKNAVGRVKVSLEMYSELISDLINKNKYMDEILEELKKDKMKLKLALDIILSLQERNYIKEFPECIDFLNKRISGIMGYKNSNPYQEKDGSICLLLDEFDGDWGIRFYDLEVYATNDNDQQYNIDLFKPHEFNNPKLRSLLLEETEIVDEWLAKLFEEIGERSKQ